MPQKHCHIKTKGQICVPPNGRDFDPCRFNAEFYQGPECTDIKCDLYKDEECQPLNECIPKIIRQAETNRSTHVNDCVNSIIKAFPNDTNLVNSKSELDPLFNICQAKCSFLISIGDFIERYLNITTPSTDPTIFFQTVYCPSIEARVNEKECEDLMVEFYKFLSDIEFPCYTNCIHECMINGGPPEYSANGNFKYDVYNHILHLNPIIEENIIY